MNGTNGEILWLITARSGSRAIPDKNIRPLNQLPLMAYRIKSALAISNPNDIWLSTDSNEYAEIGRKYGATIPFIRPKDLAGDNARSSDVVLHAMDHAEAIGRSYEFIGLLEPTSPFVYCRDLKQGLLKLKSEKEAEAIVAVREVKTNYKVVQTESKYLSILAENAAKLNGISRQDFAKQITPSGGFYISRWSSFRKSKTFYTKYTIPFQVPPGCDIEIDEPMDWQWAEFLLENKTINTNKIFAIDG